jgi:hypothetical protein
MAEFTRQQIADIINREIGFDIAEDDGYDVELNYHENGYKLHDWVVCDEDFYPFVRVDSDKDITICSVNDSESESYEFNDSDYVDDSDIDYKFYPEDDEYNIDEEEIIDFANRLKNALGIEYVGDLAIAPEIEDIIL